MINYILKSIIAKKKYPGCVDTFKTEGYIFTKLCSFRNNPSRTDTVG